MTECMRGVAGEPHLANKPSSTSARYTAAMSRRSAARKIIVSRFAAARATTPDTAMTFDASEDPALARMFARLARHGAIISAAPGFYYLDSSRLARFRTIVRRRAAALAAGTGVVATALAAAAAFSIAE